MTIQLNGKTHEASDNCSVNGLLESLDLLPQSVLVEVNSVALLKDEHTTTLQPNDRVELLRVVAGG